MWCLCSKLWLCSSNKLVDLLSCNAKPWFWSYCQFIDKFLRFLAGGWPVCIWLLLLSGVCFVIGVDFGGSPGACFLPIIEKHRCIYQFLPHFPPNSGLPLQYFWQVYASGCCTTFKLAYRRMCYVYHGIKGILPCFYCTVSSWQIVDDTFVLILKQWRS